MAREKIMPNGKHVCWIISPGGAAKKVTYKSGFPWLKKNERVGDQLGYARVLTCGCSGEGGGYVLVHESEEVVILGAEKSTFVPTGQIIGEITLG